uniref:Replication protein A 70 kDa DNA-binding subunit B/D first OB fold domain-containing protein n=1 Tax=Lactuca sativa TaxID=4236 RepID=A0A9R1VEJ2_LACSA|nr:hypothetical protein LSAT_V11C500298190 [Lactuca sativa]
MEYSCSSCNYLETDIKKQLKHGQQFGHDFNGPGGTRIHATIKKNLINAFQALLEEGAVRQITNFGMTRNEGDYVLVAHKHKINLYKTTTIRVSTPFVDRIDPFNFVSFHDLTARNFDTRVAFDFIGQVVSTKPIKVIKENARETRLMRIVAQDLIYISEHQNENAPMIILLRMAKLKTWGGKNNYF